LQAIKSTALANFGDVSQLNLKNLVITSVGLCLATSLR